MLENHFIEKLLGLQDAEVKRVEKIEGKNIITLRLKPDLSLFRRNRDHKIMKYGKGRHAGISVLAASFLFETIQPAQRVHNNLSILNVLYKAIFAVLETAA